MEQKICIFVASHITYSEQINLLEKCITSLLNQTIKCDVRISVSYIQEFKHELFDLVKKYKTDIFFYISDVRMYQMEHLYFLNKYSKLYDLIAFCDDDDLYENDRIEFFMIKFNELRDKGEKKFMKEYSEKLDDYEIELYKKGEKISGFYEVFNKDVNHREFWSYVIFSDVLENFFLIFKDHLHLLKNNYADYYLRHYLYYKKITFGIRDKDFIPLYHHLIHENSICSQSKKKLPEVLTEELLFDIITKNSMLVSFNNEILKTMFLVPYDIIQKSKKYDIYDSNKLNKLWNSIRDSDESFDYRNEIFYILTLSIKKNIEKGALEIRNFYLFKLRIGQKNLIDTI